MTTSEPESGAPTGGGLMIGEVARLLGVTTRTVRHYHSMGLVAEPARDSSGYRRYRSADLVALMRVVRLRALGMPIPQIAGRVDATGDGPLLASQLTALVGELDTELTRLGALRDRLVQAIESQALEDPEQVLAYALREHGSLGADAELAQPERAAANLLDALHPHGIAGAIEAAQPLLTDPARRAELDALLRRYQALGEVSTAAEIDALAAEVAAVLPRPEQAAPPVDLELMDKLAGARMTAAQRRFMRALRQAVERADG